MLSLRYFVWNSEKLNYLVIGMVISMMAFASTTLIIDGLSTEINSLTATVQNDVSTVSVFSTNDTFTPVQLHKIEQIIEEEGLNPYGLTREDLEQKFNETGLLSNVQFIYSKSAFAVIERSNYSKEIQLTFTNLTQLFGNAIRFETNSSVLINQGLWAANTDFFVLEERYNLSLNFLSEPFEKDVVLPATYQDIFGAGLLADWSLIWNIFPLNQTNKIEFSLIPDSLLQGLVTRTNLKRVLDKLGNIDGLFIQTDSVVSKYLEISKSDIIRLLRVLLISIFALIMISIVNSTYLLIQERKLELKVLKAIGFTRWAIIRLVMNQFLLVSLISSVFSYVASLVIFNLIFASLALVFNSTYVVSSAQFEMLFELILLSSGTSIVGTVIGLLITKKEDPDFL